MLASTLYYPSICTLPCPPSTRTLSPVFSLEVAFVHPTTAGIPSSLATIAACDKGAPISVMIAAALGKMGVQYRFRICLDILPATRRCVYVLPLILHCWDWHMHINEKTEKSSTSHWCLAVLHLFLSN